MSRTHAADRRSDPVEVLLRGILLRTGTRKLAMSVTAGLLASCSAACSSGKGEGDTQTTGPVTAGGEDASVRDAAGRTDAASDAATFDATTAVPDASDGSTPMVRPATDGGLAAALASCTPGEAWQLRADLLSTSESFDYLAVRQLWGRPLEDGSGSETWTRTQFTTVSERGVKCSTASGPACAAKIENHPEELVPTSCEQSCAELSVVTTRGDDVKRWAGPAGLRRLLGDIDTPSDALLIVQAEGYGAPCKSSETLREGADGYEVVGMRTTKSCAPLEVTAFQLHVGRSGDVRVRDSKVVSSDMGLCIGRIPEGLRSVSRDQQKSALGDYLAHCAHLEAASVVAFERLARELLQHGAPLSLIDAALEAATDEIRHAGVMAELARAHGGVISEVEVDELPPRALEEMALENATEGCVRETYGALVGAYQAEHASEPALAAALREIADDEARHASLSHRVHAWVMGELEESARGRVMQAQAHAIASLERACAEEPSEPLRSSAGLPPAELACAFLTELRHALWTEPLTLLS